MVGDRIQGPGGGDRGRGRRTGKAAKRSAPGLQIVERDGFWHVHGTVRVAALDGSRRSRRLRKGTGLPAIGDTLPDAETLRDTWALEARQEAIHGRQPSRPVSLALEAWLKRPRKHGRRPSWREISMAKAIGRRFKVRLVGDVGAAEWSSFVEAETQGNAASTRERYLNGFVSFITWCAAKPRQWITDRTIPHFERDAAARKPKHRQRRNVADWRPELIQLLIDSAGWHLRPQLYVEWSTGQRVSAILKARLRDANLAPGREQIAFDKTKTGEPVFASLHPVAAEAVRTYLTRRGRLWDREAPLFLTKAGKPYSTGNGLSGHNRKAFDGAKARANAVRRRQAVTLCRQLRAQGRVLEAREIAGQAWADRRLMGQITQHWFRHLLATTLMAMKAPVRVAMDQAGWLTVESFMAYAHDVPEVRRQVVDLLPIPASAAKAG
jgi:site-specific recombinase XerC